MREFLKVALFIFLLAAGFAAYGSSIPQTAAGAAAPLEIGESPEELISAGVIVFERENSCLTCHAIGEDPKARGPQFMEQAYLRSATRMPDLSAIEYMVESVYNPAAFTVEGFDPKMMKPVNRPPISLTDQEILAVLSYLISLSGTEVDEGIVREIKAAQAPYESGAIQVAEAAAEIDIGEGDPDFGRDVLAEFKCWQCHPIDNQDFADKMAGEEEGTVVAPELTNIGGIQTAQYLLESVMNPNAVIVTGEDYRGEDGLSKMPDFTDTMSVRQLIDLVAYLQTLNGAQE